MHYPCEISGLVSWLTNSRSQSVSFEPLDRTVGTTSFDVMISLGNLIIDDEDADIFRFSRSQAPE